MYIFISSANTKINMYKVTSKQIQALHYINTKNHKYVKKQTVKQHKTPYMAAMPARCIDHIMIFKGGEMK